jgi:DNA-binding response OmpR family regulator
MTGDNTSVLVVEDNRKLADLYAAWLNERYDTEVVYSGSDAQKRLQRGRYDVVLLDRRMPDVSGDAVLETIREEDIDCHVAIVSAVSPDFDIIEMEFDSYIVKPVMADDL